MDTFIPLDSNNCFRTRKSSVVSPGGLSVGMRIRSHRSFLNSGILRRASFSSSDFRLTEGWTPLSADISAPFKILDYRDKCQLKLLAETQRSRDITQPWASSQAVTWKIVLPR